MKNIRQFLLLVRSSLWFVPGLMIIFSLASAFVLIEVDSTFAGDWVKEYPRIFGLGADGSRGMLTAIAGSMLTVAALVFSLTLSIIAQASGQFTPRILRNFMSDRVNQFVLGYFVSVFTYCLVILRTIRGADEIKFVPSVATVFGLVLSIGGVIVLIYFIHHIASSLQVTTIIETITDETLGAIEKIFPEGMGDAAEEEEKLEAEILRKFENWVKIPSSKSGYIQYIDNEGLLDFAAKSGIVIRMKRGIGEFIGKDAPLAVVTNEKNDYGASFKKETADKINDFYNIYRYRTTNQDIDYGIRQIVDIALKALSPGINDTTTAVNCIDFLGVIVGKIAERRLPDKVRVVDGKVRVIVRAPSFQDYVETAFDQIRISGKGNQAIFLRLLDAITLIAGETRNQNRREVLFDQVDLISEFAVQTLETDHEKRKVSERISETRRALARQTSESSSFANKK